MPTLSEQINNILLMGRENPNKEKLENIMKMLSENSKDYSSKEYPKMSIDQFVNSDATQAAVSPKDMLESYYGDALPKEIVRAGLYNMNYPTVNPTVFTKIFDTIKARKDTEYGSSYIKKDGVPTANVESGRAAEMSGENHETYKTWLKSEDPKLKSRALAYFNNNSLDPESKAGTIKSSLQHEIGHHITEPLRYETLPLLTRFEASIASNKFKDFGSHTGIVDETTQALSRFQREWFKEKKTRISNPSDFIKLVDSGEIPEFLSEEGRRILIYARNLKNVKDTSEDENKKNEAAAALRGLSEMVPAVVQNKKQYGLNLKIG